jgi:hypothetical protein
MEIQTADIMADSFDAKQISAGLNSQIGWLHGLTFASI